jgi:hypothetical protein
MPGSGVVTSGTRGLGGSSSPGVCKVGGEEAEGEQGDLVMPTELAILACPDAKPTHPVEVGGGRKESQHREWFSTLPGH